MSRREPKGACPERAMRRREPKGWRDMRRLFSVLVFYLTLGTSALLPRASSDSLHHVEASRMSMGCLYTIDAYAAAEEQTLRNILEAALDEVDRIDRVMSHYRPDSPLSTINREAAHHPVAVDPELFAFIKRSMEYSQQSGGAFDITVGPLMKAWGFFRGDGHLANPDELRAARARVGAHHVLLEAGARTIRFDADGVQLDLGGIAKGYAVDRVVQILRQREITAALVSAGGSTVYGLGAPPGRSGWTVSIQDPVDSRKTARDVTLNNQSLSVAGSSEKSFEAAGVRYSHIMDPRTGQPVQGILSVAVMTGTGTDGDALDDALFVLGPEESRAYLRHYPDADAFFFLPDRHGGWTVVREKGSQ
jgi:FAD:protein FMN transferase